MVSLGFLVVFNFVDLGKFIFIFYFLLINRRNKWFEIINLVICIGYFLSKEINLLIRSWFRNKD